MPVDQSAKVTYCWRVSYPFPSNGQPYSKTTDGTTAPNADYHREHGWPVPKSGLYHPVRQMIQKILHRLINRHMVGIQIADYVPIPHFHPFIHGIHRDTRQHPLVYRTKIEIKTIPFAIFHFRGQLLYRNS